MFRFAADENFNGRIVRRLLRRIPHLDIVRVQDTEMLGRPDPQVLEWTATQDRILLTHDLKTMPDYAYDRINNDKLMPGLFAIPRNASFDQIVNDLVLIIEGSKPEEWKDRVEYLPL